jgi:predicted dehydrogenase
LDSKTRLELFGSRYDGFRFESDETRTIFKTIGSHYFQSNRIEKKMILVIGIGSIGKRHISNLICLGYNNIVLVSRSGNVGDNLSHFPCYNNTQLAIENHQISHAFVCTPTSKHLDDLTILVQNNISNIYLEKPVSHNFERIDELISVSKNFKRFVVGFDLHFDPGLNQVRQLISGKNIGNILSVNAFVGQYLPDWRPHEDHRKGMSASIEKGGGVLLDLVHEFDYIRWFLGTPSRLGSLVQHNNYLEIETEDLADVLIAFENNSTATIHLDYHQKKLVRNCIITGTNGTIKWDLSASQVDWIDQDKLEHQFSYKNFERNDRYVSIVKAFMNESDFDDRLVNLDDALVSLKMVIATKKSAQTNSFIDFKNFNPNL